MNIQEWKKTIKKHFPNLVEAAITGASVICQLFIEDISNPFGLIFIDTSGAGKTISVNFFSSKKDLVIALDNFTKASFISHASNVKKDDLSKIDLLPQLKGKLLLVREFGTYFSKREDDLKELLGILTRVFDGEGLTTSSGVHGTREYKGKYLFMMIGASTPISPSVWGLMSQLGSRIFCLYLNSPEKTDAELVEQNMSIYSLEEKEAECRRATENLISEIMKKGKVRWNRQKEKENLILIIAKLAKLIANLRGVIDQDKIPMIEKPDRLNQMLYNLARGHACLCGRNYITKEDLKIVIRVGLSTTSIHRSKIINHLIMRNGKLSSKGVMKCLGCSKPVALKYMREFENLAIVKMEENVLGVGHPILKIVLEERYQWVIEEEFKELIYTQEQNT